MTSSSNSSVASFWGLASDSALLENGSGECNTAAFERTKSRLTQRDGQLVHQIEQLQGLLQTRPCAWVPDEDRVRCFSCRAQFTLFNRRHHCRACGEVFDARCTSRTKELATYPKAGAQRVCDDCYAGEEEQHAAVDFDSLAGLLTGQTGAVVCIAEESPVALCHDDFKIEVVKTVLRAQQQQHDETQAVVAGKRVRSEIPVPPPLPAVIPNAEAKRPLIVLPKHLALKKTAAAAGGGAPTPAKFNLGDIQSGLKSLKKLAPLTPAQKKQRAEEQCSDFQLSLRKRRLVMEDSFEQTTNNSSPLKRKRNILENLLVTVQQHHGENDAHNASVNNSFAFH